MALHEPCTVEEVQAIVRHSSSVLRVLGSRHCFNGIADAEELLSLGSMKGVVSVDFAARRVTVWGGTTYGELCLELEAHGLAVHNLASLPHISVAGAVATATHGSGQRNGNLASAVVGLQLVTGRGDVVELDEESDALALREAVVGLGCLGVVTQLALRVEPSFAMRQRVFDGLFLNALSQERLDAVLGAGYSVSLFTSWRPAAEGSDDVEFHVWLKQREVGSEDHHSWPTVEQLTIGAEAPLRGCIECSEPQHVYKGMDPSTCTDQSRPGPWHERLPHFRFDFQPGFGEELQSEYFVPRSAAVEGLRAVQAVAPTIIPFVLVSEVRSIAADDLLLSPHAQGQVGTEGSVAFHFTWRKQEAEVMMQVLPVLEHALEPFNARPHWGKLFAMPRERLEQLYGGALSEFRSVMHRYDPDGRFCNSWVEATIGSGTPCTDKVLGAQGRPTDLGPKKQKQQHEQAETNEELDLPPLAGGADAGRPRAKGGA